MTLRLAVATTSRADYCHLYWPLRAICATQTIEPMLYVTAAHLSPEFGNSVKDIENDGFVIHRRIPCLEDGDDEVATARTIGRATLGFADALAEDRPDAIFLIADRYEMLAPASVALAMRIPIVHLEGGEISEGAVDDCVRNALTKMAHIHLTPHDRAAGRVRAMGEEPWRVHVVGAPSLDHLRQNDLLDENALQRELEAQLRPRPILVAYHPVTLDSLPTAESDALFQALRRLDAPIWFCFPNADIGYRRLIEGARAFAATKPDTKLFVNLRPRVYWSLLHQVRMLVGNSSSGIMETASVPLATVNIGRRQKGRLRCANVIDADPVPEDILRAIARAASPEFETRLKRTVNVYGDGRSSTRIVEILGQLPDRARLLNKRALQPPGGNWT